MRRMDQRRLPRFTGDQSVSITFGAKGVRIAGQIRNISGEGMGLQVLQAVDFGTSLTIEVSGTILAGEVIYCRKHGDGFHLGVKLARPLHGFVALSRPLPAAGRPA